MKLILTLLATCAVASVLFVTGCSNSATSSAASTTLVSTQQGDDVLGTPGGYAYRADVHEGGQTTSFPAIQTTAVTLGGGGVTYRAAIQTTHGTTRHNIVDVYEVFNGQSTPSTLQLAVTLSLNSLPAGSGVTASIGDQWFGPATTETILSFVISPQIASGDYQFSIGVEVNGQSWGTVPCTIHVTS